MVDIFDGVDNDALMIDDCNGAPSAFGLFTITCKGAHLIPWLTNPSLWVVSLRSDRDEPIVMATPLAG